MKKALITGITGQDGSYLAELLLNKGYEVHGIIRRASTFNTQRIDHIYHDPHNDNKVHLYLHYGDIAVGETLQHMVYNIKPDEIYHLAAQSHVRVSFDMPEYTGDVTGLGTIRILEAVRKSGVNARFYQASSSEMFGGAKAPQNEVTVFEPRSPYAAAKVYAYWITRNYREAYDIYASNGILFNHESPRRGETFVTRKITRAVASIKAGRQKDLFLGNLDSKRDWGYAPEYVEAMWMMLQLEKADDYVIGTGETHSVREFLEEAFGYAGMNYKDYVQIDERYFRPTEVDLLLSDPSKANQQLKWQPKVKFHELVRIMIDADLELMGLDCPGEGQKIVEEKVRRMASLGSPSCQYGQIVGKKAYKNKRSVLFVCAANQCRSPMAMVMFIGIVSKKKTNPDNWRIESAGIWAVSGYSATENAIKTMKDMGLELDDHSSQPVTESLLNEFKLILCMEIEQVAFLKRNFPDSKEKVFLLSEMADQKKEIWDPAGYSLDSYKDTAKEIFLFLEKGFHLIFKLSK